MQKIPNDLASRMNINATSFGKTDDDNKGPTLHDVQNMRLKRCALCMNKINMLMLKRAFSHLAE